MIIENTDREPGQLFDSLSVDYRIPEDAKADDLYDDGSLMLNAAKENVRTWACEIAENSVKQLPTCHVSSHLWLLLYQLEAASHMLREAFDRQMEQGGAE